MLTDYMISMIIGTEHDGYRVKNTRTKNPRYAECASYYGIGFAIAIHPNPPRGGYLTFEFTHTADGFQFLSRRFFTDITSALKDYRER